MATISSSFTKVDAVAAETGSITNVKVGDSQKYFNDVVARTSVTKINAYLGELDTDLTNLNEETGNSTDAIGTAVDSGTSSGKADGTLYERVVYVQDKADGNKDLIGTSSDTSTKTTLYGLVAKHTEDVNKTIGSAATSTANDGSVYGRIKAEADTASQAESENTTAIGNSTDSGEGATSIYGLINNETSSITSLSGITNGAFVFIGSVETLPSASDKYYTVGSASSIGGNYLTFSSTTSEGAKTVATGNVINVKNTATGEVDGMNYAWDGEKWDALGMILASATESNNGYMTKEQVAILEKAVQGYAASYDDDSLVLTHV